MRTIHFMASLCVSSVGSVSFAQDTGSLAGTVIREDGSLVVEAPVRARSAENDADARIYTDEAGRFELADLPPGTYVLSINMPCCSYAPYLNGGIVVSSGAATRIDVELAETGSMNTLSDDPGELATELRDRQDIPDLPVPRMPGGEPDLSGVWIVREDPFPEQPRLLPWAAEETQRRFARGLIDAPHVNCLPSDPPVPGAVAPFMGKFVQTDDLLVVLFEDAAGFLQIFLDGRDHPENPNPTWLGHSIGSWEGDTLVVSTVGFNDRGWTESFPRTEMLKLETRYHRPEYGLLSVTVLVDDPGVFEEPWTQNMTWYLAPQEEIMEYVCENNRMTND